MLKKIAGFAAGVLLLFSPTMAHGQQAELPAEVIFKKQVGSFHIRGNKRSPQINQSCMMEQYTDRHNFVFVLDASYGEVFIRWSDATWNILDEKGTLVQSDLVFEVKNKKTLVRSGFLIVDTKNIITIRKIDPDILDNIAEYGKMHLMVKGKVRATVDLKGSKDAMDTLMVCYKTVIEATKPEDFPKQDIKPNKDRYAI